MTKQKTRSQAAEASPATDSKRRNFMIGAGLGSIGAAAALVSSGTLKPAAETAAAVTSDEQGYRETEHIRRYYGTTRL